MHIRCIYGKWTDASLICDMANLGSELTYEDLCLLSAALGQTDILKSQHTASICVYKYVDM